MWLKGCTINESWCELQNFGIEALKKVRWLQAVPRPSESWNARFQRSYIIGHFKEENTAMGGNGWWRMMVAARWLAEGIIKELGNWHPGRILEAGSVWVTESQELNPSNIEGECCWGGERSPDSQQTEEQGALVHEHVPHGWGRGRFREEKGRMGGKWRWGGRRPPPPPGTMLAELWGKNFYHWTPGKQCLWGRTRFLSKKTSIRCVGYG